MFIKERNQIRSPIHDFWDECPDELLLEILNKALSNKWNSILPLSFVNKRWNKICDTLVNEKIYFIFMKIKGAKQEDEKRGEMGIRERCGYLKKWIERPLSYGKDQEERPIHQLTKMLLSHLASSIFDDLACEWEALLNAKTDLNAFTSQRQTPLLLLCDYVVTIHFSLDVDDEERVNMDQRLLWMLEKLLEKGADPNLQGFPSIPLMMLMVQAPNSRQDALLEKRFVEYLVRFDADPDLIPLDDCYHSNLSPRSYAQRRRLDLYAIIIT